MNALTEVDRQVLINEIDEIRARLIRLQLAHYVDCVLRHGETRLLHNYRENSVDWGETILSLNQPVTYGGNPTQKHEVTL